MSELVNYYYDHDHKLTHEDDEGCLVALCTYCNLEYQMQFAGKGDSEAECYDCDAVNNPGHKADMLEYYGSLEDISSL